MRAVLVNRDVVDGQVRELLRTLGLPQGDQLSEDLTRLVADRIERKPLEAPPRDVREVRGVIDAAESVDMDVRTGVIGGRDAGIRQAYANGAQEALEWVLGADPAADLERLMEGDD